MANIQENVINLVTALRNVDNAVDEADRAEFRLAAAKAIEGIVDNFHGIDYCHGNPAADALYRACIEMAVIKATK